MAVSRVIVVALTRLVKDLHSVAINYAGLWLTLGQETEERAACWRLNLREPVLLMRRALLLRFHSRVLEIAFHTRRWKGSDIRTGDQQFYVTSRHNFCIFNSRVSNSLNCAIFVSRVYYKILIRSLSSLLMRFRFRHAPRHNFISFRITRFRLALVR